MSQHHWLLQCTEELGSVQSCGFTVGIRSEKYTARQFYCYANIIYWTCRQFNLRRPLWRMEPAEKHHYVTRDHKYKEETFKTAYYRLGIYSVKHLFSVQETVWVWSPVPSKQHMAQVWSQHSGGTAVHSNVSPQHRALMSELHEALPQ